MQVELAILYQNTEAISIDFDPYNHLEFLTNRIGRLLAAQAERACRGKGLDFPISCIGILAELWNGDGIPQKDLSLNLIKNKSSVTTMLDALERNGLIHREQDSQDARSKLIYLTEEGRSFQDFFEEHSSQQEVIAVKGHNVEEIEITKRVLSTVYNNLVAARRQEKLETHG